MFEIGKIYTRKEIQDVVGGNKHSFLPRYKGKVVAACLRPDLNPDAPEVILCGSCPPERTAAEQLAKQGGAIPVFMKAGASDWRYQGMFRIKGSETHPDACKPHAPRSAWAQNQIKRVIRMEKVVAF